MTTKQQLETALLDAMRASDNVAKRTIRMVLTSIKLEEVARHSSLDEAQVAAILHKEVKLRREAIEDAKKAKRPDLIADNEDEIRVLETFLPKQLSEAELNEMAQAVIAEIQATGIADMGKVMKALLPKIQGQVPNELASQVVRQLLMNK
ncbi:MAG: GatB/YqeY domain-containing protein [Chloroflexi bacterium]|nr:GatB/YqeY domain-containing protein [Chloroflexota bacterium]